MAVREDRTENLGVEVANRELADLLHDRVTQIPLLSNERPYLPILPSFLHK